MYISNHDLMVGKILKSVDLSADKARITFAFADGTTQAFGVSGDCCSNSWIEHMETPGDVDGAKVLAVEESDVVVDDSPAAVAEHEHLQVYQTFFRTDKGTITLEYRNSSNGYYGGSLDPIA